MKRRERSRAARMQAHLQLEALEQRQLLAADLPGGAALLESTTADDAVQTPRVSPLITSTLRGAVIPTTRALNRSFDGTNNNLRNPQWGSTDEQLLRVAPAEYGDGVWTPGGTNRPSPRAISNALVDQDGENSNKRGLSAFIFAWGQFIDHDIDLTGTQTENGETFPIEVPDGDEFFDPDALGGQVIGLTRSLYDPATGAESGNPRQQMNQITAWIDGSMVYGSDQATADSLRSHVGGRLLVSAGDLPPADSDGNFFAGDVRANENIGLTSMHALFIREHNWWADHIARENPRLGDEAIYRRARAIVIAEIQAITFNEFLPALLGQRTIDAYAGYDRTVDPSIANEFSTAAFRLHTFINDEVGFVGNDGRAVRDKIELAEAFFNPALLRETGADTILKHLASTHAQEFDNEIVDSLRNFLFGLPGQGGFDLASLNIQRGRDHGLADYNDVREAYGLTRVDSFDDITSDSEVQATLEELYGDVDNIDLWVGATAEDHVRGSSVGELVQTIVADQFERLRDGDRFWYQRIFSGNSLRQIENTSLSDVIRRNTSIRNLQENVFFLHAEVSGRVFLDLDGDGRQDRRESAVRGVTIELLDDEGRVIATTTTNRSGRYKFDEFHETGDFQIRVVAPNGYRATRDDSRDVLISRGDKDIDGVDFGLRPLRNRSALSPLQVDAALTDTSTDTTGRPDRRR